MTTAKKNSKSFVAGVLTAIAASLCCITPVLAFIGGAGGLASSASWIAPFRPYLIAFTILIFAFAWYQKLMPQKQVDCNCETRDKRSFLQSKTFLTLVTVTAALLIAFPYYAKALYPAVKQAQVVINDKSDISRAKFTIKGMTCESCTEHVNREIAKVRGVINFRTSYDAASSVVTFDNNKTSIDTIAAAIAVTGYTVVTKTVIKN